MLALGGAIAISQAITGCVQHVGKARAPAAGSPNDWQYDVVVGRGAAHLFVDARLPPRSVGHLVVSPNAEPFLLDAEVEGAGRWRPLTRAGVGFLVPECVRGCHVRYRFELRAAARALSSSETAVAWGNVLEAPPSTWLLHPTVAPPQMRYRFRVRTPEALSFATGVFPTRSDDAQSEIYEAEASTLGVSPYAVFGPLRERALEVVQGIEIDLVRGPASFQVDDDALVRWVARSARTVGRFFGCFPVRRAMIFVAPASGQEVRHGEMMGDGGASIVVELGEGAREDALESDWILPHEMTHLAVPSVSRTHHWIEEGLALYFEPIARARLGELAPEDVWLRFANEMPSGLPVQKGEGLDGATDWRRTYWGGALFCLFADLEIRRRSGNRLGLDDALRGVLAAGGSVAEVWPFDRLLDVADAAVGLRVLRSLYAEMGRVAWRFDLPRLFRDLGVRQDGGRVTLVDDAPLAAFRWSITAPLPRSLEAVAACTSSSAATVALR